MVASLSLLAAVMINACAGPGGAMPPADRGTIATGPESSMRAPAAGDAGRGRALLAAHDDANCILCHEIPDSAIVRAGDLGPSLAGIGRRASADELRARIVDMRRFVPGTIMPSYGSVDDLRLVAPAYRGRPILSPQQIEDIVAFLVTLR